MLRTVWSLKKILAIRVKLVVGDTEIIMNWRAFEDALLDASPLTQLEIVNLSSQRKRFHKVSEVKAPCE